MKGLHKKFDSTIVKKEKACYLIITRIVINLIIFRKEMTVKNHREYWSNKLDNSLHNLMVLYKSQFEKKYRPKALEKLTVGELGVLNLIEQNPELSIREAIQLMNIPNSTLTSIVDRMERKNLLKRKTYLKDKRIFILELTEFGKQTMAIRKEYKNNIFSLVYDALENDADRETFINLVEKISDKANRLQLVKEVGK